MSRLPNQVIVTPPGADHTATAVRCHIELAGTHQTRLIVWGSLLYRRVKELSRLPASRRITKYHAYGWALWKTVLGKAPDSDTGYDLAFHQFLEQLRTSPSFRFPARETLVVVQGQRLPLDFYRVLRVLDLPVIAFVDPTDVDDDGATTDELVRLLSVAEPRVAPPANTAAPILDLVAAIEANSPFHAASGHAAEAGPLPLLAHHPTAKAEARFAVDYARLNPTCAIGVLVPTVDLVRRLHDDFIDIDAEHQWYHSGACPPERESVVLREPGLKVLTWRSAQGLKFDRVVLPAVQTLTENQLSDAIVRIATTARHQLVLSYSGQGVPGVVALLPSHLLEQHCPDATGIATSPRGSASPPAKTSMPPAGPPAVAGGSPTTQQDPGINSAVMAARQVVSADRTDLSHRHRVLTAEEEVGLAQLMRGNAFGLDEELPKRFRAALERDDERATAFDAFITHNDGLVRSIANRYSAAAFDADDLYQYGVIGLIRAVEKFDATAGTKFSTYATHWINQSISRAIPDDGTLVRIPVHAYEAIRKVQRTRDELLRRGTNASIREISARTQLTPTKVVELLRLGAGILSLDKPVDPDAGTTIGDMLKLVDPSSDPDLVFDREALAQLVSSALAILDERGAEIMRLRYGFHDGVEHTLEQIGDRFDVTRERIRQIEAKNKERLGTILRSMGFTGSDTFEPVTAAPQSNPRQCTRQTRSPLRRRVLPQAAKTLLAKGKRLRRRLGSGMSPPDLAVLINEMVERTITAGARSVSVQLDQSSMPMWLAFVHDGRPFLGEVLRAALELTDVSEDIRQSDVRLLGSAMRAFDELGVWEGSTFPDHGVALTNSRDTDLWWLRRQSMPVSPDVSALAPIYEQVVVLQIPAAGLERVAMRTALATAVTSIGVTFGDLLWAKVLNVSVDGCAVRGLDPFLWENTRGQDLGVEIVKAGGFTVKVNPRVLPPPDALRAQDRAAVGSPEDWTTTQGFYVRCGGRYVSCAGWFGLPGLDISEKTALARVVIEIAERDRPAWGPEDAPLSPPEPLRQRLIALATLARRRSEAALGNSGRTS